MSDPYYIKKNIHVVDNDNDNIDKGKMKYEELENFYTVSFFYHTKFCIMYNSA